MAAPTVWVSQRKTIIYYLFNIINYFYFKILRFAQNDMFRENGRFVNRPYGIIGN